MNKQSLLSRQNLLETEGPQGENGFCLEYCKTLAHFNFFTLQFRQLTEAQRSKDSGQGPSLTEPTTTSSFRS